MKTDGYVCYLRITERTQIQYLLKKEIKRLTKRTKENIPDDVKRLHKSRKKTLARIYSKMEHLF